MKKVGTRYRNNCISAYDILENCIKPIFSISNYIFADPDPELDPEPAIFGNVGPDPDQVQIKIRILVKKVTLIQRSSKKCGLPKVFDT